MAKYTYSISIEATNENDALAKMKAASTLMKKLKPKEIGKLAEVVAKDPVKTAIAKKALGL